MIEGARHNLSIVSRTELDKVDLPLGLIKARGTQRHLREALIPQFFIQNSHQMGCIIALRHLQHRPLQPFHRRRHTLFLQSTDVIQGDHHQVEQGLHHLQLSQDALLFLRRAARGQHGQYLAPALDGDEVGHFASLDALFSVGSIVEAIIPPVQDG